MSDIADRYHRRADAFRALIAGTPPEAWANPSPCAAWDARGVVGHIIDMHSYMLRPLDRSLSPAPELADDPLGAFDAASADVRALLADPEIACAEHDTPGGRMTTQQQIDLMVSEDLAMHGWDLARATGQDDTMHPEDVARMWEGLQQVPAELMAQYRTPGAFGPGVEVFGPEVPVPADAPVQHRLLGFIGRDPHWTP